MRFSVPTAQIQKTEVKPDSEGMSFEKPDQWMTDEEFYSMIAWRKQ
jgi:hypothetical protein